MSFMIIDDVGFPYVGHTLEGLAKWAHDETPILFSDEESAEGVIWAFHKCGEPGFTPGVCVVANCPPNGGSDAK